MEKLSTEDEGFAAGDVKKDEEEELKDPERQDHRKEAGGGRAVSSGNSQNEEEVIAEDEKGGAGRVQEEPNESQGHGYLEKKVICGNSQQDTHKVALEGEEAVGGGVADQRELEGDVDAGEEEQEVEELTGGGHDEQVHSEKEVTEGVAEEISSWDASKVEAGAWAGVKLDYNLGAQEAAAFEDGTTEEELFQGVRDREPSPVSEENDLIWVGNPPIQAGAASEESGGIGEATVRQDLGELPEEEGNEQHIGSDLTERGDQRQKTRNAEDEETARVVHERKLPERKHAGSSQGTREGCGDAVATELSDNSTTAQTADNSNNQGEEPVGIPPQAQAEDLNKTKENVHAAEEEVTDKEGGRDKESEQYDNEVEGREEVEILERPSGSAGADSTPGGEAAQAPSLGSAGPSLPARPTRTARSSPPSMEAAPRRSGAAPSQSSNTAGDSHINGEAATPAPTDGNDETRKKLHNIRIKLLRLASRLGQSTHSPVVAQVLYRLGLAEQLRGSSSQSSSRRNAAFSLDRAIAIASEAETAGPSSGPEELDFTCTIMLLGKTGVGKSATVNSIFDGPKTGTNAFSPSTTKVRVITGYVNGAKVRVIDTPGLLPSVTDQGQNRKAMASVKWLIRKQAPDIVLYFDRLDMQSRDYGDLPLLRTITDTFGAAVWFNAIVVLTHASTAPPDGPNGLPLGYEMFISHRSHAVQENIRQAAGDVRLMNPVSLVENHPSCRVNRFGQRVLPNGQLWKPQLLMLCFASKILAEANSVLKLQDNAPGSRARGRVPPLPFLLSSLLQSRAQLKMPDEQAVDEGESDDELDEDDDSDDEDEDYEQLPPFRRLTEEEVTELDKNNRGRYFEELAERERLFQKKHWKEEKKRRRELRKRKFAGEPTMDPSQLADEGLEDDMARSTAVAVPMPDLVLPPSFDSDNPTHRYRYLETANQWLVRPVLETHGWDHDTGYDGMNLEKVFALGERIPVSVSGQIIKDKKDTNLNLECAALLKLGPRKATLAGLDVQSVGKDVAYTLRSETGFSNFKGNKTTGGLAVTLLGDTISTGMKIENRLIIGKRVKLVLSGGTITGRGDVAYGGSLEATLRDKDYPLSRTLSSLGLSIMDWHGDLAVGGNFQSQFMLGNTMVVGRGNLNNRGAGQICIRVSSSEQVSMALIGLWPIIRSVANHLRGSQSQE